MAPEDPGHGIEGKTTTEEKNKEEEDKTKNIKMKTTKKNI